MLGDTPKCTDLVHQAFSMYTKNFQTNKKTTQLKKKGKDMNKNKYKWKINTLKRYSTTLVMREMQNKSH